MLTSTHTWKTVYIEGSQIKDEESFHREFSFKFGFPDYYGMNFNALYDCFSSLDEPGVSKHWKLGKNEEIVIQIRDAISFIDQAANNTGVTSFLHTKKPGLATRKDQG